MDNIITTEPIPMAYDEATPEEAARRIGAAYDITVTVVAERGPGGWPDVTLSGPAANVVRAYLKGWSSGDPDEDAELLFLALGGSNR